MKHKETAKAWLDGQPVQVYNSRTGIWEDTLGPDNVEYRPSFRDEHKYRIKPQSRWLNVYATDGSMLVAPSWHKTRILADYHAAETNTCIRIGVLEDPQDGSPYIFHPAPKEKSK